MGLPRILQRELAERPRLRGRARRHPAAGPRAAARAAGGDDVGAAELRLAQHRRQPARRLLARRPSTSTGSGSTSTRSSPAPSTRARRFFDRYDSWPFVIGEYGPWDNDYGGAFTGGLFRWAEATRPGQDAPLLPRRRPRQRLQPPVLPGRRAGAAPPPRQARWDEYAPGVRELTDPPPPPVPPAPPQARPLTRDRRAANAALRANPPAWRRSPDGGGVRIARAYGQRARTRSGG